MNEKLLIFIENSFLKPLLDNNEITDISYNGVSIFYVNNKLGRIKSDIEVSHNEVIDFIRQIANYSEKQFSYSTPYLDVTIGRYRIDAVHPSLVRVGDEKSCSFSIRIASLENKIRSDKNFLDEYCKTYLLNALKKNESLVIAGPTGSGKTELQKYLLLQLTKNTRIIVIDNIQELENLRVNENLDLTSWQITQNNSFGKIQDLIKLALRSNPDWLVIAESRGEEMNDILNSVLTGHPVITTLHARSLEEIPKRICRMIQLTNTNQKYEDINYDVCTCFRIYIFLNRKINSNGKVERYIESIGEMQSDLKMKIIYRRENQC